LTLLFAAIAASAARPAGAVTFDANFDSGSLLSANSSTSGNTVTVNLAGRDNFNPGLWKWLYFKGSGVAGQQVIFNIDDDFATGGSDLVGHKMVYSYDNQNWSFFDVNFRTSPQNLFTFYNPAPVPVGADDMWVAYGLPYSNGRVESLAAELAASPWVSPTLTANPALVIGQSPGGVDDLGRTIAPRDMFGFKITDSASTAPKARVVLVGGVHANETLGSFTLEGLLDFLVGDTLEAGVLRRQAEFYVYPMANPDGRFAGYNRSTVQRESLDPNRYWVPPNFNGLDDIEVVGDAMLLDAGASADYLIDFHSDVAGKTGHYGNVLPQWQSNPLWLNFLALEPTVDTNNALLEDDTTAKFGRDRLGADFSITFETQFLPDENIDRFLRLGENWGHAFFRTLNVFADLNLDGALTAADWSVFITNSETDLTGLSATEKYLRGDLDADGVNSYLDFGLFKTAYEQTHGPGAFEAMLAVPEPAGLALAAVCLACLSAMKATGSAGGLRVVLQSPKAVHPPSLTRLGF
jgi:hypothetical protein